MAKEQKVFARQYAKCEAAKSTLHRFPCFDLYYMYVCMYILSAAAVAWTSISVDERVCEIKYKRRVDALEYASVLMNKLKCQLSWEKY